MKLSLSWIADHIAEGLSLNSAETIVARFNQITAEIEHFHLLTVPLDQFFVFSTVHASGIEGTIKELNKKCSLTQRPTDNTQYAETIYHYLVKKEKESFRWATLHDFGAEKAGLVPSLAFTEDELMGTWRKHFIREDIIFEVDNKSITHRPDMWSHRGFAREIAAFMGLTLKDKNDFLAEHPVQHTEKTTLQDEASSFSITNLVEQSCKAFNGLVISSYTHKASHPLMASRLMAVDARPMNSIIDVTNYLMLDWGQPAHAYDAATITDKKIIIRQAREGEELQLLDGKNIALTPQDMVIANAQKPMCLAGVKGSETYSVSPLTTSLFFEAANFTPGPVRKSALYHKTRTDSSSRFEKTLDQNLALEATYRFMALLEQAGIKPTYGSAILSLGKKAPSITIEITHTFIEQRLGLSFTADEITKLLAPLEFAVSVKYTEPLTYEIVVPSFRASKDIKIKEDIIEEIIRSYGFNNVPLSLPPMHREPFNSLTINRARIMRTYLAHSAKMMEQRNYALFDEQFITTLGFNPEKTIQILNPVSENFLRLVTSLIPGLLKNIHDNFVLSETLSFFESGRVWHKVNEQSATEEKKLSGIFFEKRKAVDFYHHKYQLNELFKSLGLNVENITWKKTTLTNSWFNAMQAADIFYGNEKIGTAGLINHTWLNNIDALPESSAFIFELNNDFLTTAKTTTVRYKEVSRFQETYFDISILIPLSLASRTIQSSLKQLSPLITDVTLIDFYESKQASNQRALTFRIWLQSLDHTLEKGEIDAIYQQTLASITNLGAQLRS